MSFIGSKPRKMNFNSLLQIQKDIFKREGRVTFLKGPHLPGILFLRHSTQIFRLMNVIVGAT